MADTAEEKEWQSPKDVRRVSGIGRTKAYKLVATSDPSSVGIGRCIRINRGELEGWLQTQRYLDETDRGVA